MFLRRGVYSDPSVRNPRLLDQWDVSLFIHGHGHVGVSVQRRVWSVFLAKAAFSFGFEGSPFRQVFLGD